jgi:hypothetical protein
MAVVQSVGIGPHVVIGVTEIPDHAESRHMDENGHTRPSLTT